MDNELNKELENLEEQYRLEKLRGLSKNHLEDKRDQLGPQIAALMAKPSEGNAAPSPEEMQVRVMQTAQRCQTNIDKVKTERNDMVWKRRFRRVTALWDRFNETLRSVATVIRN